MSEIVLCENCNADASGHPTRVTIEGGWTADGVEMGRQEFAHQLCGYCLAAVARLDWVAYVAQHESRRRQLDLP